MTKLIIRTSSLPTRCDVCHQSDQFDRVRSYCERCQHASYYRKNEDQQLVSQVQQQQLSPDQAQGLIRGTILGFSSGLGCLIGLVVFRGLPETIILGTMLSLLAYGFIVFFKDKR